MGPAAILLNRAGSLWNPVTVLQEITCQWTISISEVSLAKSSSLAKCYSYSYSYYRIVTLNVFNRLEKLECCLRSPFFLMFEIVMIKKAETENWHWLLGVSRIKVLSFVDVSIFPLQTCGCIIKSQFLFHEVIATLKYLIICH